MRVSNSRFSPQNLQLHYLRYCVSLEFKDFLGGWPLCYQNRTGVCPVPSPYDKAFIPMKSDQSLL